MTPNALQDWIGREIGCSGWVVVDQNRIDAFAEATDDRQFIHLDPDRAAQTPFGGTVAHGFLTLSMLSALSYDALPDLEGQVMGVNTGFERVRFITPVRAGARIRARFTLTDADLSAPGEVRLILDVVVEIEGAERPALVATWLQRRYFGH